MPSSRRDNLNSVGAIDQYRQVYWQTFIIDGCYSSKWWVVTPNRVVWTRANGPIEGENLSFFGFSLTSFLLPLLSSSSTNLTTSPFLRLLSISALLDSAPVSWRKKGWGSILKDTLLWLEVPPLQLTYILGAKWKYCHLYSVEYWNIHHWCAFIDVSLFFWVLCKISPLENLFNPPNKFVLGLSQSLMSLQLGRGFKKWRGCGFFSKKLILWVFCKIFP